jgi:hypothetical protein
MAAPPINDRIAKKSDLTSLYRFNILFRNIANAQRDEVGAALPWTDGKEIISSPLATRLDLLIEDIKNSDPLPDALFLLEAARPSRSMSWTEMAARIERETGLTYIGVVHLNATALPFGKALFINRRTTAVRRFNQLWVSDTPEMPSGDYFGTDALEVHLSPVQEGRIVVDRTLRCMALHAPMALSSRLAFASWVRKHAEDADIFFGDTNTFEDDGGPEMLRLITEDGVLVDATPDVDRTFVAFPQDVMAYPSCKIFPPSTITSKVINETMWVRHVSVLDRCFARRGLPVDVKVYPITEASDHAMVSIRVDI